MEQLGSLFKLVFFRVIFNSLVGIVAIIVFVFFINNDTVHYTNIKITHLDNIWIFLIFITILGEIIIALGEIIVHHFPFEYNPLINDEKMEYIAPKCFNINNNDGYYFTYNKFISIFDISNRTVSEISELNFVIGGVFAGLGFISLTLFFYFILLNHNKFTWLLFIMPLCLLIIICIICIVLIYFKKPNTRCSLKDKINLCAMAISIYISIFLAYFLIKLPNNNISLPASFLYIILFNILITIFLFYQAMLRMAYANHINCAIIQDCTHKNAN